MTRARIIVIDLLGPNGRHRSLGGLYTLQRAKLVRKEVLGGHGVRTRPTSAGAEGGKNRRRPRFHDGPVPDVTLAMTTPARASSAAETKAAELSLNSNNLAAWQLSAIIEACD